MRIAILLIACLSTTGCVVGSSDMADAEVDAFMLDRVAGYQAAARVNQRPYGSELGAFQINCYVTGDSGIYRRVHPERSGAAVTMPWGTVIVREVLDTAGQVTKLTVMAKGPAGYDPSLGDWWFAVTDPRGAPLQENSATLAGRLTQCHNCHLERAADDFLFGVPSADS